VVVVRNVLEEQNCLMLLIVIKMKFVLIQQLYDEILFSEIEAKDSDEAWEIAERNGNINPAYACALVPQQRLFEYAEATMLSLKH